MVSHGARTGQGVSPGNTQALEGKKADTKAKIKAGPKTIMMSKDEIDACVCVYLSGVALLSPIVVIVVVTADYKNLAK